MLNMRPKVRAEQQEKTTDGQWTCTHTNQRVKWREHPVAGFDADATAENHVGLVCVFLSLFPLTHAHIERCEGVETADINWSQTRRETHSGVASEQLESVLLAPVREELVGHELHVLGAAEPTLRHLLRARRLVLLGEVRHDPG